MKALVHIGLPKTGSTSLQYSLAASRDQLAKSGFLYPTLFSSSEADSNLHQKVLRHLFTEEAERRRLFANVGAATPQAGRAWLQERVTHLDAQIAQSTAHTCILSGESFIAIHDVSALHRFLRDRFEDIQIIAYIRPPYEEYPSYVQHSLGSGNKISDIALPQHFFSSISTNLIATNRHNSISQRPSSFIQECLQSFAQTFGHDRVNIICFSRERLIGNSIVSDFAQRFLQDNDQSGVQLPDTTQNLSVAAAPAIFISMLSNFSKLQEPQAAGLRDHWLRKLRELTPSDTLPKLQLPKDWKVLVAHVNSTAYRWIEGQFWPQDSEGLIDRQYLSEQCPPAVSQTEFEAWLLSHFTVEGIAQIFREVFGKVVSENQIKTLLAAPRRLKTICNYLDESVLQPLLK